MGSNPAAPTSKIKGLSRFQDKPFSLGCKRVANVDHRSGSLGIAGKEVIL